MNKAGALTNPGEYTESFLNICMDRKEAGLALLVRCIYGMYLESKLEIGGDDCNDSCSPCSSCMDTQFQLETPKVSIMFVRDKPARMNCKEESRRRGRCKKRLRSIGQVLGRVCLPTPPRGSHYIRPARRRSSSPPTATIVHEVLQIQTSSWSTSPIFKELSSHSIVSCQDF